MYEKISKRKKAERFEDLEVWGKAHQLVLNIYRITKKFPEVEKFTLVSQMRRAAVSVPANIAEGFKKRGIKDKANFYNIAQGSLSELRYYLILSRDLEYCNKTDELYEQTETVGRMLNGLIKSLR